MDEPLDAPIQNLSESPADESGTQRSTVSRRDLLRLTLCGGAGLALDGLLDVSAVRAATKNRGPHSRLGRLPPRLSRRRAVAVERRRRRRSRPRWANGGRASRRTGLRNVAGMARGPDPRSGYRPATRADGLAPHRGLSPGRRDSHPAVPRVVALSGVDGDVAVPASRGERLRRLARRGALASPVLPHVRIPAGDGAAGRLRPRGECVCSRAAAAARAGSSSEPVAPSVKPTPSGSRA
jgi:hypothetical protein